MEVRWGPQSQASWEVAGSATTTLPGGQGPWVSSSTQPPVEGEKTWLLKQLHSVFLLVTL